MRCSVIDIFLMLSVRTITVHSADTPILSDVSVDFAPGTVCAVMGPNGSGKSTLARTLIGDPALTVVSGDILLDDASLTHLPPYERARRGVFYSPQSPPALPGITVQQLLREAVPRDRMDSKKLLAAIADAAAQLHIPHDLLSRSLNDNFSGGERKKMEVLQALILAPRYIILDEIDTGVDVDAVGVISHALATLHKTHPASTLILITHYARIFSALTVDAAIVMRDGTVARRGDAALVAAIDAHGYDAI